MASTKKGATKTRTGGRPRRPVQNRRPSRRPFPTWAVVAGALAVLAVLIVVVRDDASPRTAGSSGGVAHVHGLGTTAIYRSSDAGGSWQVRYSDKQAPQ